MRLFHLSRAAQRDEDVERWFGADEPIRALGRPWFECMRGCGADVRELLHDGRPTACVGDAAFGYVDAHIGHVNVGFFQGAALPDPAGLLVGGGRFMRHVKVRWGGGIDEAALKALIHDAYGDVRLRLEAAA